MRGWITVHAIPKALRLQSQRHCVCNPNGIAAYSPGLVLLPWVARDPVRAQPQRGCGQRKLIREQPNAMVCCSEATGGHNPVGVAKTFGVGMPRSTQGNRVRQPWARDATPFGVATTIGRVPGI
jgi:hypothetical protein